MGLLAGEIEIVAMAKLFKDQYRIKSSRLQNWNYGWDGFYFVTICTKNDNEYFGEIVNNEMVLNKIGEISANFLSEIPDHFDNAFLDESIVMPNHIHAIIQIWNEGNTDSRRDDKSGSPGKPGKPGRDEALPRLYVNNTRHVNNTQHKYNGDHPQMSAISPKPKSLPVIIGSFKSIVTKTINKKFPDLGFKWQPKYHDHVIRNITSLQTIRNYIKLNPSKWNTDQNHIEKIEI